MLLIADSSVSDGTIYRIVSKVFSYVKSSQFKSMMLTDAGSDKPLCPYLSCLYHAITMSLYVRIFLVCITPSLWASVSVSFLSVSCHHYEPLCPYLSCLYRAITMSLYVRIFLVCIMPSLWASMSVSFLSVSCHHYCQPCNCNTQSSLSCVNACLMCALLVGKILQNSVACTT